jgi:hypothetical protein
MPVALFIAGNFWLVAALTFGFWSDVVQYQPPARYRFLNSEFDSNTYYACLAMFVLAAVICFVLSYVAWRRQHNPHLRSTGAAGAFPVIPASNENGAGH